MIKSMLFDISNGPLHTPTRGDVVMYSGRAFFHPDFHDTPNQEQWVGMPLMHTYDPVLYKDFPMLVEVGERFPNRGKLRWDKGGMVAYNIVPGPREWEEAEAYAIWMAEKLNARKVTGIWLDYFSAGPWDLLAKKMEVNGPWQWWQGYFLRKLAELYKGKIYGNGKLALYPSFLDQWLTGSMAENSGLIWNSRQTALENMRERENLIIMPTSKAPHHLEEAETIAVLLNQTLAVWA